MTAAVMGGLGERMVSVFHIDNAKREYWSYLTMRVNGRDRLSAKD